MLAAVGRKEGGLKENGSLQGLAAKVYRYCLKFEERGDAWSLYFLVVYPELSLAPRDALLG